MEKMIIKWDKGWFKALGLHHGLLVAGLVIVAYVSLGLSSALAVYGFMCGVYFEKERRENGDEFEILDFLSPLLIGFLTIWIVGYYA